MRTRDEIVKDSDLTETISPEGSEILHRQKLQLEVLLDIRDQLAEISDAIRFPDPNSHQMVTLNSIAASLAVVASPRQR